MDQANLIIIALAWPRQVLYDLLVLLIQFPIPLPLHPELLTQDHGCIIYPVLSSLYLLAWLASWLNEEKMQCSEAVQQILFSSTKPSTRTACSTKWKRFLVWPLAHGVQLTLVSIQYILEYLLYLQLLGLALSSLRVYLAAIALFHPPDLGRSVFSNAMVARVLKELLHLHPPI